jgi:hypothetical protein
MYTNIISGAGRFDLLAGGIKSKKKRLLQFATTFWRLI